MAVKKSMNFIVPLVVYPFDIMFSFGETDEEIIKRLDKFGIDHANAPWQFERTGTEGRTCVMGGGQTLVRMTNIPKSCNDYGNLAHEIFHAVELLFNRIGIKHHAKYSGEAYAYLIGYITEQAYTQINKLYERRRKN